MREKTEQLCFYHCEGHVLHTRRQTTDKKMQDAATILREQTAITCTWCIVGNSSNNNTSLLAARRKNDPGCKQATTTHAIDYPLRQTLINQNEIKF